MQRPYRREVEHGRSRGRGREAAAQQRFTPCTALGQPSANWLKSHPSWPLSVFTWAVIDDALAGRRSRHESIRRVDIRRDIAIERLQKMNAAIYPFLCWQIERLPFALDSSPLN